ncbi:hypothetical protein GCM10009760_30950 [Kitasatospora kazusensis]|uniref:PPE domain-containing protein n=2 Tax=Kitasatospora kazusensis TaxID=407974 RepID=A0ABN2ZL67_9ACTN
MVHSMDSGGVMAAGDPWRRASDTLKQIRTTLDSASGDATSSWEGPSSDAFYSKMTKLAASVNNIAAYANDAAITMKMMSEAIDEAKHAMPEEPSFLDKVGDAVGDTAKSAVGVDDASTRTTITDEKKAQAVAVMEVLATKYRAASSFLKPPPFGAGQTDDVTDIPPPADPTGSAAISALIVGGGMGLLSANGTLEAERTTSRSDDPTLSRSVQTPQSPRSVVPGPSDPGIRGGLANPLPKPKAPGSFGPGTGLDGVPGGSRPGGPGGGGLGLGATGGGPGEKGLGGWSGGSGGGTETVGGAFGGRAGGGGDRFGRGSGPGGRGGGAFGSDGLLDGEGGAGAGSGAGGRGGGLGRRSGAVMGEPGEGTSGRRSFTEGGSGIGRGRAQAGQEGAGKGHGGGAPGGAQGRKKDRKQDKDRPDYLVEDEETWASGELPHSNVVE